MCYVNQREVKRDRKAIRSRKVLRVLIDEKEPWHRTAEYHIEVAPLKERITVPEGLVALVAELAAQNGRFPKVEIELVDSDPRGK